MKQDTLKVGTSKGEFAVNVTVDMPETLGDIFALAKASADLRRQVEGLMITPADAVAINYVVAKYTRGYRIDLQEGGARQAVIDALGNKNVKVALADKDLMEKVKADVVAEIKGFDPAAPRARAKKAAPQVITLEAGKESYTAEEVEAMLAKLRNVTIQK